MHLFILLLVLLIQDTLLFPIHNETNYLLDFKWPNALYSMYKSDTWICKYLQANILNFINYSNAALLYSAWFKGMAMF